MIHVYALVNLWPIPADTVADDSGKDIELLETLDGVYTIEDLCAQIKRPLSKSERDMLKRDGEVEINGGAQEVRLFEIEPNAQIKGWVDKSFDTGINTERDRLWSLACFFYDELVAALAANTDAPQPAPFAVLKEFAEMVLDGEVAPVRYHMKGPKKGRPVAQSATSDAPRPVTPSQLKAAVADVCIECGSPLDNDGHCHFMDCSKGVHPLTGFKDAPLPKPDPEWVCNGCGHPFGLNPAGSAKWPQTVCVNELCKNKGAHVGKAASTFKCCQCVWPMQWRHNDFFTCVNPACKLRNTLLREIRSKEPKALPPAATEDCCTLPPEGARPVDATGHMLPITEAIASALNAAHRDEESK